MAEVIKFDEYYDNYEQLSLRKYLHYQGKKDIPISYINVHESLNENFDIDHFFLSKNFEVLVHNKYMGLDPDHNDTNKIFFNKEKLFILSVRFSDVKKIYIPFIYSFLDNQDEVVSLITELKPHFKIEQEKRHINFLGKRDGGFFINKIELDQKVEIDFNLNYNNDFKYQKVQDHINNKNNGLILLGGVPGSGKSYYIKYLIHNIERPFLYIPNQYVELLTSPEFISFAIDRIKDYVLILEDSENVLLSRELNKNSAVPTILNLTDGIIGSVLNLTIICTYNTKDLIDTALFRKGRLLYDYHFGDLAVEKCNNLAKKLNSDVVYTEPTVLAEIYNTEENRTITETKSIGFSFTKRENTEYNNTTEENPRPILKEA